MRPQGKTTSMFQEIINLLPELSSATPVLVIGATTEHTRMLRRLFNLFSDKELMIWDRRVLFLPWHKAIDPCYTLGINFREIFVDNFAEESGGTLTYVAN